MSLYQDYEVEVSRSQLSKVLKELGGSICLLGGWAVYITVNKNFSASQGRNFMGSRDIDLGFHIDPSWTDSELRSSIFAQTIKRIGDVGFKPISFRYVKQFHTETREELSEEQAMKVNQSFIFDMYIDPIVDKIHPRAKQVLGFVPIDEPLLSEVFGRRKFVKVEEFGAKLILPKPEVLLATKLNSVSNRDKQHKRLKDIADIYGLLWYSDAELSDLKREASAIVGQERTTQVVSSFTTEDYAAVSQSLGVEVTEVSAAIAQLKS
ncbi:MAG: hypothetical protein OK456_10920 [Thaumarchaeota archaeon]|nr:hypothetical protein [Nitrososphaerota archaeon]